MAALSRRMRPPRMHICIPPGRHEAKRYTSKTLSHMPTVPHASSPALVETIRLKYAARGAALPAVRGVRPAADKRERERSPEQRRRLQEAKFCLAVVRAVRQTINSERWQRDHKCVSLQQVWKLWQQAAVDAEAKSDKAAGTSNAHTASEPTLVSSPAVRVGRLASRATRVISARHATVARSGALQPQRKLDLRGLQAALAFTFPDGTPLGEAELLCVYRSLDQTHRGYVTLSTFSSVFAQHRRDQDQATQYYQALPTWGDTIGGYIPKNEKVVDAKRVVTLQHGRAGEEMPENARGVAGGFGLGHEDAGGESLGWQLLVHGDLDVNVLRCARADWRAHHSAHHSADWRAHHSACGRMLLACSTAAASTVSSIHASTTLPNLALACALCLAEFSRDGAMVSVA